MSLPQGTMIGNYRIDRPIGSGGFSTVYLANDDRLDASVAVKILAENRALDVDARRRFVEEAQRLRKVESGAVVTVYDVGETSGRQPYMVLEFADRGDLAHRLQTVQGAVGTEGCMQVVDFLHRALSALHGAGLVHRDVKPHNILIRSCHGMSRRSTPLLNSDEVLLLGDLGFVKDLTAASGLTVGGGTWAYQAPEQRNRMGVVDARADIYSASALVARLLVGQEPADGHSWHGLLGNAAISHAIRSALFIGLSELPEDRHQSVDLWQAAMQRAFTPPEPMPSKVSAVVPSFEVSKRGSLARLWRPIVGSLLLVGLGGVAAGWSLAGDDEATVRTVGNVVSTAVEIDGDKFMISGPSEIRVGQRATFVATVPDDVEAWWISPNGEPIAVGDGIAFTADTPGEFSVTLLIVTNAEGAELLTHRAKASE